MRVFVKLLSVAMVALPMIASVTEVFAGSIRNTDNKEYEYSVHWSDLSPPESGKIGPKEVQSFADKPATVDLHGQKDNIYVRPGERILIVGGIMRIEQKDGTK